MEFRKFVENYKKDVKETLAKLPKKHQSLIKGYKFKSQPGNTLKGDDEHVGITDDEKKTITVCGGWFYSREMINLHEIAHKLWKNLSNEQKDKWEKIVKNTKKYMPKNSALNQNTEEIFCMTYATEYAKHPPVTYQNKARQDFIKNIS